MKKVFPLSFRGKNLKSVVVSTLLYTLIALFVSFAVFAMLWNVSLASAVSIALNIFKQFVILYCVCGIVVAVLYAANCLGQKNK